MTQASTNTGAKNEQVPVQWQVRWEMLKNLVTHKFSRSSLSPWRNIGSQEGDACVEHADIVLQAAE